MSRVRWARSILALFLLTGSACGQGSQSSPSQDGVSPSTATMGDASSIGRQGPWTPIADGTWNDVRWYLLQAASSQYGTCLVLSLNPNPTNTSVTGPPEVQRPYSDGLAPGDLDDAAMCGPSPRLGDYRADPMLAAVRQDPALSYHVAYGAVPAEAQDVIAEFDDGSRQVLRLTDRAFWVFFPTERSVNRFVLKTMDGQDVSCPVQPRPRDLPGAAKFTVRCESRYELPGPRS